MSADSADKPGLPTPSAPPAASTPAAPGPMMAAMGSPPTMHMVPPLTYTQKVMIAVVVSAAAVLLTVLAYYTMEILVLCFAGLLFAVFLSAPADLLSKHTRIKRHWALGIVLVTFAILVVGGSYFMGYTITKQSRQLAHTLPGAMMQLGKDLQQRFMPAHVEAPATAPSATAASATGSATAPDATAPSPAASVPATGLAVETAPATAPEAAASKPGSDEWVAEELNKVRQAATDFLFSESFVRRAGGVAGGVVSSTFGVIGNIAIVMGVGLFFALNPRLYSQGLITLVPRSRRNRASEILATVGTQLEWWFVGQLCSMFSIALLTYIGLTIIGVPMAVTLAILAGLLNFIPNFGPIIAAAPAVLIAFAPGEGQTAVDPARAGWVLGLYIVIQLLEGWVITPFFQQRAVELPPALIIISQVVLALLLGPIGLILATPILAATLVVVRMVYVEDVLGDKGEKGKAPG